MAFNPEQVKVIGADGSRRFSEIWSLIVDQLGITLQAAIDHEPRACLRNIDDLAGYFMLQHGISPAFTYETVDLLGMPDDNEAEQKASSLLDQIIRPDRPMGMPLASIQVTDTHEGSPLIVDNRGTKTPFAGHQLSHNYLGANVRRLVLRSPTASMTYGGRQQTNFGDVIFAPAQSNLVRPNFTVAIDSLVIFDPADAVPMQYVQVISSQYGSTHTINHIIAT